ncbi:MAG: hypothetical protein JMN24_18170 [gamma proteobacterium endosymbiont of Lamellibrachia anaximandri]|nr:hypothetical protein [gamma proteobacterium endosymbiont of Lamellibrachia anaximandri]MBL3619422.1 hypothetical protein [gamma proteobacterium endosymbiont of Lamellibrachia anaximandri]
MSKKNKSDDAAVRTRRNKLQHIGLTSNATNKQALVQTNDAVTLRKELRLDSNPIKQQQKVEVLAQETTTKCVAFARNHWPELTQGFEITAYLDWRIDREYSRGGIYSSKRRSFERLGQLASGPGISIAMVKYVHLSELQKHQEYKRFNNDPEIGSLGKVTSRKCLQATIAHECAHAIHQSIAKINNTKTSPPHGKAYQNILRALRIHLGLVRKTRIRTKSCAICKTPLSSSSVRAQYCSAKCRKAAQRTRDKAPTKK